MDKYVVIALGGSLLKNENSHESINWKSDLIELITSLIEFGSKVIIIIGGGQLARDQINSKIKNGVTDKFELDLVGIKCTRDNAKNFLKMFDENIIALNTDIPESIEDIKDLLSYCDLIVMGGTVPGQTTDAVAIQIGKEFAVKKVFIATNVSYVFTDDPRKNDNAKPIKSISLKDLGKLSGVGDSIEPGSSFAVDPIGVGIAISANLPLVILNGYDVANLRKAISGENFIGTNVFGE